MSVVTNIILTGMDCNPDDTPVAPMAEKFLRRRDSRWRLTRIDQYSEGSKALEAYIWVAACNGMGTADILGLCCVLHDARLPPLPILMGDTQLFIKRQDDELWWEIAYNDLDIRPRQYVVTRSEYEQAGAPQGIRLEYAPETLERLGLMARLRDEGFQPERKSAAHYETDAIVLSQSFAFGADKMDWRFRLCKP